MKPCPKQPPAFPNYWTPRQALVVFEFLELLQDQLWSQYGRDIQHALRTDLNSARHPHQYRLPFDDQSPF